jgi:ubiquinone/menaquinone biosynthesis C-methylase UbiE
MNDDKAGKIDDSLPDTYCRVRQQFDYSPYPRVAIATSAKEFTHLLFANSLTTAYYIRDRQIVFSEGKHILDVGCGSGVTSLVLAEANPKAKVVGIDISPPSIDLARERLQYHGFADAEFHVMGFEELPQLNQKFDYINCDETLYLLPDQVAGLNAMRSVLHSDGIIRANLHSLYQRIEFFRAQKLSKLLGLMDGTPTNREYSIMKTIMAAVQDSVMLKAGTWLPNPTHDEFMQANYFLQEDKGFTIPDVFRLLKQSDLNFISMVDWKGWDLGRLFVEKQIENPTAEQKIPEYLAQFLASATTEQKLHFYELLNPMHRLLDFWCGHLREVSTLIPPESWQSETWESVTAHLHPVLKTPEIGKKIDHAIAYLQPFNLIEPVESNPHSVNKALCLKLLWDGAKTVSNLAIEWMKVKPAINLSMRSAICVYPERNLPVEPLTEIEAVAEVKQTLLDLESDRFVMLEICGE